MFVSSAADILADTSKGLSATEFLRITKIFGLKWGVAIPHINNISSVPNKRTALCDNLMAFDHKQRCEIIYELCLHPALLQRNPSGAQTLKNDLISRYGHMLGKVLSPELDTALIERTKHFLGPHAKSLELFQNALAMHSKGLYERNLLDNLRLSLELLLCDLICNTKSLENQIAPLGQFLKVRSGSPQLSNMFVNLIDYYCNYQNTYVKHDDAVIEEEVEFIFELTASFMKHFVRLSSRELP